MNTNRLLRRYLLQKIHADPESERTISALFRYQSKLLLRLWVGVLLQLVMKISYQIWPDRSLRFHDRKKYSWRPSKMLKLVFFLQKQVLLNGNSLFRVENIKISATGGRPLLDVKDLLCVVTKTTYGLEFSRQFQNTPCLLFITPRTVILPESHFKIMVKLLDCYKTRTILLSNCCQR